MNWNWSKSKFGNIFINDNNLFWKFKDRNTLFSPNFKDLINNMLAFTPSKRYTLE